MINQIQQDKLRTTALRVLNRSSERTLARKVYNGEALDANELKIALRAIQAIFPIPLQRVSAVIAALSNKQSAYTYNAFGQLIK